MLWGCCSHMPRLCLVAAGRGGSRCKAANRSLMLRRFLLASARLRVSTGAWRDDVVVLGVETSCDDTGVAVIRGDGHVMGEALQSQTEVHKL